MKALRRAIDKFCLEHRRFGVPRLMMYIVFITAAVYLLRLMDTTGTLSILLAFSPVHILRGEIWRLVTWVFLPTSDGLIFTAIALYFYYFIGSTLEREWGAAKFTVYYIFGVLLNIIYGFLAHLIFGGAPYLTPFYLNMSMFFAFAVLFPEHRILLFYFIPVKIKWAALAAAAMFAFLIVNDLLAGNYAAALVPVIALLNFFIICGDDLMSYLRPIKARGSRQAINFRKASREARRDSAENPYRHKCAVCGKTDAENPGMEFRYCSRCSGYHCFCAEHINNHVHFQ